MSSVDVLDRYLEHSKGCANCKPATVEDPVCVPCPTGQKLWNRYEAQQRIQAASAAGDPGPGPSVYPLGGLDEYRDD